MAPRSLPRRAWILRARAGNKCAAQVPARAGRRGVSSAKARARAGGARGGGQGRPLRRARLSSSSAFAHSLFSRVLTCCGQHRDEQGRLHVVPSVSEHRRRRVLVYGEKGKVAAEGREDGGCGSRGRGGEGAPRPPSRSPSPSPRGAQSKGRRHEREKPARQAPAHDTLRRRSLRSDSTKLFVSRPRAIYFFEERAAFAACLPARSGAVVRQKRETCFWVGGYGGGITNHYGGVGKNISLSRARRSYMWAQAWRGRGWGNRTGRKKRPGRGAGRLPRRKKTRAGGADTNSAPRPVFFAALGAGAREERERRACGGQGPQRPGQKRGDRQNERKKEGSAYLSAGRLLFFLAFFAPAFFSLFRRAASRPNTNPAHPSLSALTAPRAQMPPEKHAAPLLESFFVWPFMPPRRRRTQPKGPPARALFSRSFCFSERAGGKGVRPRAASRPPTHALLLLFLNPRPLSSLSLS